MWQPVQKSCSSATTAASPLLAKSRLKRSSKSSSTFAASSLALFCNSSSRLFSVASFASRFATCRADRFLGRRRLLFFRGDLRFQLVGLLHQLQLLVFDPADFVLVTLDLAAHRGELVVLARLVLLRLQPRDAFAARADVELKIFLVDLELARALSSSASRVRGGRGHLVVERFALCGKRPELGFHLPDFLSAILQNKELLQLGLHARTLGARGERRQSVAGPRPSTMQALIPPKPNELLKT